MQASASIHAATSIKTLTLNIGAIAPMFSEKTLHRVHGICLKLSKSNYDVVFIQEAWTAKYRKMLKDCGLKYSLDLNEKVGLFKKLENNKLSTFTLKILGHFLDTFLPDTFGYDTGLMILSRSPFLSGHILRFPENGREENAIADGEFPVNKGAIGGIIEYKDFGKIFVATTHLVSEYEGYSYIEQREKQIISVYNWLQNKNASFPTIIGGDFNMAPPNPDGAPRYLNTHLLWNKVRDTLLADYLAADIDYQNLSTYTGTFSNKSATIGNNKDQGVLDHIFSFNGLIPISGGIDFVGTVYCGIKNNTIINCPYSDHYGMKSTFILKDITPYLSKNEKKFTTQDSNSF